MGTEEFRWLQSAISLDQDDLVDNLVVLTKPFKGNQLIDFMKHTLIDYHRSNCHKPVPIPVNNERTIYVEVFVPVFKYFGNSTGSLAFTWYEKQLSSNSIWYMLSDYSKGSVNKKFVEGVGISVPSNHSIIIIKSSGYSATENVDHMLEDTLKNLKNASDCLKALISEYKLASFSTFKKLKIFSIHVIQRNMTLVQYSTYSSQK